MEENKIKIKPFKVKLTKYGREVLNKMKKRKERRGLAFKIDTEYLNLVFDLIKKRKYKLIPKDAQIHSMSNWDACWDGYTIIMTSKEFPIVEEGCECLQGDIKVDKEKGIIELKERR